MESAADGSFGGLERPREPGSLENQLPVVSFLATVLLHIPVNTVLS